ncbi:hypothetical protein [Burkholderia aenigmatica]|uniref:hypothetical protein n=1 Tax=Burkholderia aenigmatica TaxID=2015348 RepID=UPI00264D07FA|nr:hypothetical protein [Burkholderia aenigmatica]MDN7880092.1 hypothetical protein [Burkholderia aenigmatica]
MKISKVIAYFEGMRAQYGEIDVACTAGYQLPEDENMADWHLRMVERDGDELPPDGVVAPYLLIGGPGF